MILKVRIIRIKITRFHGYTRTLKMMKTVYNPSVDLNALGLNLSNRMLLPVLHSTGSSPAQSSPATFVYQGEIHMIVNRLLPAVQTLECKNSSLTGKYDGLKQRFTSLRTKTLHVNKEVLSLREKVKIMAESLAELTRKLSAKSELEEEIARLRAQNAALSGMAEWELAHDLDEAKEELLDAHELNSYLILSENNKMTEIEGLKKDLQVVITAFENAMEEKMEKKLPVT